MGSNILQITVFGTTLKNKKQKKKQLSLNHLGYFEIDIWEVFDLKTF